MKNYLLAFRKTSIWNRILLVSGFGLISTAVFAPVLPLADPNGQDLESSLYPPAFLSGGSIKHLLGTDLLGRDVFSRLIFGTRLTVAIAVSAVVLGAIFGSVLGVIAGFKGGKIDALISRITEAQLALPFILGLRVSGCSDFRIIFQHIVPNIFGTILSLATLEVGTMILAESALSFLGIGVPPPGVSWGSDLASGKDFITMAWWLVTFPGISIVLTVLFVNTAGDSLRSHFDSRKRIF